MKKARCKMKCDSVNEVGSFIDITMQAVAPTKKDPDNARFWNAAPSATLRLHIDNVSSVKHIKEGDEFYIDIVPAND